MHLDDERAERLLHGELRPQEEIDVRAHLALCDPCRQAFDQRARDEVVIFTSFSRLDQAGRLRNSRTAIML